jgi:hypothetical protein
MRKNPGAGRPAPRGRMRQIIFGLVPTYYQQAIALAETENRPVAKVIESIVEAYFDGHAGNGQLTKSHPVQLQPQPFDASHQLSAQGYTPGPHRVESARSAALAPLPIRAMPSPQPPKMVATMLAEELPEEGPEEDSPQEAAARRAWIRYLHAGGPKPAVPRPW